jgi:hypothetical protein
MPEEAVMTRSILVFAFSLMTVAPATAQWLDYPTPDLPRTADGKPNLAAAAPRTADGKPDLSGLWRLNGVGYVFNILGAQQVEMLPWAKDVYAKRSLSFGRDSPDSNCLPPGPNAGLFGMEPVKFIQAKNVLVIMYEGAPTRQVFLDGRPLPKDPNPTWMGYSVGRWDGDTLIVDTTGYNDRTWLDLTGHPHTEALHVTERFHRLNTGEMKLEMTFDDPKTYARPWTISVDAHLEPDSELLEFVCNENERSSRHYTGDASADVARAVTLPPAVVARYAGEYNAGPLGVLKVVNEGGSLALVFPTGGARHAIVARSEEDLSIPDLGVPLRFIKGGGGEVTHLRVTTVEGDLDAPRVTAPSR